jgi:glycosyltransferase involved in cell wall biosynthesis
VDTTIFKAISKPERDLVRQQLGFNPGDFVLLNVGGAFWNKGGDLLLGAYAELKKEFPRLKLLIKDNRTLYGRTTDQMVADLDRANPGLFSAEVFSGIVTLPVSMTMDQLRLLYGAADLYVSPYRAEGFNLPVMEAMACGTRVLVTGGGATDDFFEPSFGEKLKSTPADPAVTGIPTKGKYLEPDYEDLKMKLRDALSRPENGGRILDDGVRHFARSWTWKSATEQLLGVMFPR